MHFWFLCTLCMLHCWDSIWNRNKVLQVTNHATANCHSSDRVAANGEAARNEIQLGSYNKKRARLSLFCYASNMLRSQEEENIILFNQIIWQVEVNFSAVSLIRRQRQFYTFVRLLEALRTPALKRNRAFIQMLVVCRRWRISQQLPLEYFSAPTFSLRLCMCLCALPWANLAALQYLLLSCIAPHIHAANISSPRLLRLSTNILELRSLHGTGSDLSAAAKSLPLLGEIFIAQALVYSISRYKF